jgi:cell division protein FtsW
MKSNSTADRVFLLLILVLTLFGLLMIYNATVVFAQKNFGESYRFVLLHIGWLLIGTVAFYVLYKIDYKKLFYLSFPFFLLTLLPLTLLAFVAVLRRFGVLSCDSFAFAPCVNGVTRWFSLNPAPLPQIPIIGVVGFQPSEMAKLSLIVLLASVFSSKSKNKANPFWVFLTYTGVTSILIFLQPNLSTAVLVFGLGAVVYFAAGKPLKYLLAAFPLFILLAVFLMFSSAYRRERVMTYLGSNTNKSANYHVEQVNIALGSGGMFGKGLGQSRQKFQFLPEVTSDSIFAIVGEELGWVGTTSLIVLFTFFVYRGLKIGKEAEDDFGRLLAVGIISWVGIQYLINVAAMTGIIPLTGVPLPLVSYGGSSTVFLLAGLGIVANVSKNK